MAFFGNTHMKAANRRQIRKTAKEVPCIPKNLHMKFGEGRVIGLKMRALQSCINMAIFQKKSSKIPFFK